MHLKSPSFDDGGAIPLKFTCEGKDINPELNFIDVPINTATLALIMEDPDAPGDVWDHWILFNILPGTEIAEGSVPKGALQGRNSWGKVGYGGPCPPIGIHRYVFKLYALDRMLNLPEGIGKAELKTEIKGHILAEAMLTGKYGRKR